MSLSGLLFGTQLIEILQSLFAPESNWIFVGITSLGDGTFLAGLSAVIYWCFDKSRGRLVTYVLFFGAYLNSFLKILVPWPRPPVELRIVQKNDASNGFPSGHVQDSTTFWTWISLDFRRSILAALGVVIVAAVGISRIYLGVHYPAQVIGGYAVGLAVAVIGMIVLRHLPAQAKGNSTMLQLLFAACILAPLPMAAALGAWTEIDLGRVGGYLFGFWIGTLVEGRYVGFRTDVSPALKILRIAIGGATTGLIILALGQILPETYLVSSFASSLIQGLTVALIIPIVFSIVEGSKLGVQ